MVNLETGEKTLRDYIAQHPLIATLEAHLVHPETGTIHPDVINFGRYFAQLFNRGGTPPERRIFAPGLLTRVYNPQLEENRPFVFAIGAGGSARMMECDSTPSSNSARDFILDEIIGWNREQIMAHRGLPLRVRITHKDTVKEYAKRIGLNNGEDIPDEKLFPNATWKNVLYTLGLHIRNTPLEARLARVAHLLPLFGYDQILAREPIIAYLRTSLSEVEAKQLAEELANIRRELLPWGIGDRFNGTGRLPRCNEYVLPAGLFFTSPGIEIELP